MLMEVNGFNSDAVNATLRGLRYSKMALSFATSSKIYQKIYKNTKKICGKIYEG